ncbi:MAG: lipid-A-disaccharide synthase [Alphaproteobacteria bacterium]|nr:lipid-A-disaccharide synthase [Alphaproteobacteria bacterium]
MTLPPRRSPPDRAGGIDIFLVAVEESGDRLGAALMKALRQRASVPVRFSGVGGRDMTAAGLASLHPIDDFSIIGFTAIPRRLPRILRNMRMTVRAVLAQRPHALVIVDSPGYSLWVARFVRRRDPSIPIVDYVSPSVWAWRPGRARAMRDFVDHVLALLPFEPGVHQRLGGPPCSYVGHPLIEEISNLRPNESEQRQRASGPPTVLALPGSRSGEVERLAGVFGQALGIVQERIGPLDVVVPTVEQRALQVAQAVAEWPVKPRIVVDPIEKRAAIRIARAALAKSGTVTLELALAGVPMVAAYKVSPLEAFVIRRLVRVPSYILANLVIGQNVVPELVQEDCTPERLADALIPLIGDTQERRRQMDAFSWLDTIMEIGSRAPAARAADLVLGEIWRERSKPDSNAPA